MNGSSYAGWRIWGGGDSWYAVKWGVRMRGNSEELIRRMIDLRGVEEKLPR